MLVNTVFNILIFHLIGFDIVPFTGLQLGIYVVCIVLLLVLFCLFWFCGLCVCVFLCLFVCCCFLFLFFLKWCSFLFLVLLVNKIISDSDITVNKRPVLSTSLNCISVLSVSC